jgi:hypothetical protein
VFWLPGLQFQINRSFCRGFADKLILLALLIALVLLGHFLYTKQKAKQKEKKPQTIETYTPVTEFEEGEEIVTSNEATQPSEEPAPQKPGHRKLDKVRKKIGVAP